MNDNNITVVSGMFLIHYILTYYVMYKVVDQIV